MDFLNFCVFPSLFIFVFLAVPAFVSYVLSFSHACFFMLFPPFVLFCSLSRNLEENCGFSEQAMGILQTFQYNFVFVNSRVLACNCCHQFS